MPELPEVETVKNGLLELLQPPTRVRRALRRRSDLRFAMPRSVETQVRRQTLQKVERRAKYLFFHFPTGVLVNHLGMTGSWRRGQRIDLERHDHFFFEFEDDSYLIYRDPRRFGVIDWAESVESYWQKKSYGPEPMSESFNATYLWEKSRGKKVAIKTFLMDQRVVVGIGNIYASEILFRCGVRPTRRAGRVTQKETQLLIEKSKEVLAEAIAAGGSTISDFRQAGGGDGYFQHRFDVYAKEGQPCCICEQRIKAKVITGRSSFYCPQCQPR